MALSIGIVGAATGFMLWNFTRRSHPSPASALLLLTNPQGRLRGAFTAPRDTGKMIEELSGLF